MSGSVQVCKITVFSSESSTGDFPESAKQRPPWEGVGGEPSPGVQLVAPHVGAVFII